MPESSFPMVRSCDVVLLWRPADVMASARFQIIRQHSKENPAKAPTSTLVISGAKPGKMQRGLEYEVSRQGIVWRNN